MKLVGRLLVSLLAAGAASPAFAQATIPLTISGNEARGTIELPGGIGAELTLSFEQVVGLTPTALDVSASLVDPLDPGLLARLPGIGPPGAFPVLLRIEPSAASALSFSGVYAISLHTHNLSLQLSVPLLLFSAPLGGTFNDITTSVAIGSYRPGGGGGGFSEFLIVADARPIDTVIRGKFDRLQSGLNANGAAIAPAVLSDLQGLLNQARSLYQAGSTQAAISAVEAFSDMVKAQSGTAIPDVWRAHDDRVNVAGLLRSRADTLKFSLNLKESRSP